MGTHSFSFGKLSRHEPKTPQVPRQSMGQLGPQGIGRETEGQCPEFRLSELVGPTLLVLRELIKGING